jgi:hypothetical protein
VIKTIQVPAGTTETALVPNRVHATNIPSFVPNGGLAAFLKCNPALKRWAIFKSALYASHL